MFKTELMEPNQRQALYQASTLMLTKTVYDVNLYVKDLTRAKEKLDKGLKEPSDQYNDCKNKYLNEFLTYIISNSASNISLFPLAVEDEAPGECKLLEMLSEQKYFPAKTINKEFQGSNSQ
jgi:hypothetical protein